VLVITEPGFILYSDGNSENSGQTIFQKMEKLSSGVKILSCSQATTLEKLLKKNNKLNG